MQGWHLRQRELVAIWIFWMALASLSAVNRLVDPRATAFRLISPTGPILLGYVEGLLWALLTPAIFFIAAWSLRGSSHVVVRAVALLAAGLLVALVANAVLDFFRFEVFDMPRRRRAMMMTPLMSFRPSFLNQLIVYFAVVAAGVAREYSERDRVRQRETERLATHAAQLQAQLAEARLEALRMQINPHFLFNTLHAVSALVERDPAGVRRMIARLSELLRTTLDSAATPEVPLRQELEFIRRYVEIMNVRFQGRLRFEESVDAATEDALVPSLILQPLVENALKHGLARSDGGGRVELSARRDGEGLVLAVADDGPGPHEATGEPGIGLANTRERLQAMYGEEADVTLERGEDGRTLATVRIPWREAGDR